MLLAYFISADPAAAQARRAAGAAERSLTTFTHIPSPNSQITNAILRDERGFIWFGTTGGLCRYDGYQTRVVTNESPLASNVLAMERWRGDSLLLATDDGLWLFDARTELFRRCLVGASAGHLRVTALAKDSSGTLWLGTVADGLLACDSALRIVRRVTAGDGLHDGHVTALSADGAGNMWAGTLAGGVSMIDASTRMLSSYRDAVASDGTPAPAQIEALCPGDGDEMLVSTAAGLYAAGGGRLRRLALPGSADYPIWAMARGGGRTWLSASGLGLVSIAGGRMTAVPLSRDEARSLASARLIFIDPAVRGTRDTQLWTGTRSGVDVLVVRRQPFTNFVREEDGMELGRGAVLSFAEDHEGLLWIGLWGGGIDAFRRVDGAYRRVAHFEHNPADPSSLPSNDVNALQEAPDRTLWVGTRMGLAVLDAGRTRFRTYRREENDSLSLPADEVGALTLDRASNLWVSTSGGLARVSFGAAAASGTGRGAYSFARALHERADAHPVGGNTVTGVLQDRGSRIWAATYGRGLNRLEPDGSWTRFRHPGDTSGTAQNFVYALAEDAAGMFWLSTSVGLVHFDPRTGTFTDAETSGLGEAHIFGMAQDAKGRFWLSTRAGLARVSGASAPPVRYDESDGIAFEECFSGLYRRRDGALMVGGIDGFAEFIPESVAVASQPPALAFTGVTVSDSALPRARYARSELRLPYDQNYLSFSFAVLDYVNPPRNRFSYRMDGVDKDWVDAQGRNFAGYPNLAPGHYTFTVRGCSSDNVWNEAGISVAITILPPYWQTWWFRALLAASAAFSMYAVYRYRLRKLIEVERLRLRIADDLHDDVGSNLSTIAIVSRSALRDPGLSPALLRKLEEIYDTALASAEGMKDIVWFIKPKDDTLQDLLLRMKDAASAILGDAPFTFESPAHGTVARVSIDFKRDFYLSFKETLNNVVKHAEAANVRIQITLEGGMLVATVRDDGRGFDPAAARRGNGLGSLRARAAAMGGRCDITSSPGRGTAVRFSGRFG
jgi:ligand-binding sensor domain-containing protein/signal transduction histidine kinase